VYRRKGEAFVESLLNEVFAARGKERTLHA
jgi:hypothetical protein